MRFPLFLPLLSSPLFLHETATFVVLNKTSQTTVNQKTQEIKMSKAGPTSRVLRMQKGDGKASAADPSCSSPHLLPKPLLPQSLTHVTLASSFFLWSERQGKRRKGRGAGAGGKPASKAVASHGSRSCHPTAATAVRLLEAASPSPFEDSRLRTPHARRTTSFAHHDNEEACCQGIT